MGLVALVAFPEVVTQNILHHDTSQPCISMYCSRACVAIELAADGCCEAFETGGFDAQEVAPFDELVLELGSVSGSPENIPH